MRSTRMLAPRPNLVLKTTQTLAEGTPAVGPRLIFPTAKNVEKWENLIGAVTTGLELRKQLERVNAELRIAKQRIAAAIQSTNNPGGPKPTDVEDAKDPQSEASKPDAESAPSQDPESSPPPSIKHET